jgi:hypothetical protein
VLVGSVVDVDVVMVDDDVVASWPGGAHVWDRLKNGSLLRTKDTSRKMSALPLTKVSSPGVVK